MRYVLTNAAALEVLFSDGGAGLRCERDEYSPMQGSFQVEIALPG